MRRGTLITKLLPLTVGLCALLTGCGDLFSPLPAAIFAMPLTVAGEPVGAAIVDTGGGFEVMLRENFGLDVVREAQVLAFEGPERVGVTEGFAYNAAGWHATSPGAIVGLSVCDCNGLGVRFFRKTGAVLALDFKKLEVAFRESVPPGGMSVDFAPAPDILDGFDTSFINISLSVDGKTRQVVALLDTGSTVTLIHSRLLPSPLLPTSNLVMATIHNPYLGTVEIPAVTFDTEGLPDVILGTNIMGRWADRWYFSFSTTGGTATVFEADAASPNVTTASSSQGHRRSAP